MAMVAGRLASLPGPPWVPRAMEGRTMRASDIDNDTLEQAEREAMQRPSNSAMWDDRLYQTHAPVMSWAERGDDILAESNYLRALEEIQGAAGDNADDHVIDATVSDWLVGSLRQIFVQIRDDAGNFTDAWREAVSIALALQEYPILDESDYSEREWNAYHESAQSEREWIERGFEDDTDADREKIWESMSDDVSEKCGYWGGDGEISSDWLAERYREARNAYFESLAAPLAASYRPSTAPVELPGQLSLI